ncbi:asparaginase [uncultured Cohaesibacter sp.]|uniref:asparaginase n=1 Tax=uncultured Cohaesibacter sp. TaxID=1002546 RepID=UPI002931D4F0|nr:asparaginase [uncultured Cohaesibacter sp.]
MAVLVEVTRGSRVESWHMGAIAVVDASGALVASIGDIESPVFPRSAIKGLQALPLIESGAADAYHLQTEALSIACASHNGEQVHVDTVKSMLKACGLEAEDLECGAHSPRFEKDQALLHLAGHKPIAANNNCSGKHAGFLCFSQKAGFDHHGYIEYDHPVQKEVRAVLEQMTGFALEGEKYRDLCGTDGCSIPTYAIPLRNLAHAFARFGTGVGLESTRAEAAKRLRQAVAKAPYMVAGHDRFCTSIMEIFGERAFVKTGAEGVFCATLPEQGLGIALKCWDGASRASEVMMAAVLDAFLPMSEGEAVAMETWREPKLINWNGRNVGSIKLADGVLSHLMQKMTV